MGDYSEEWYSALKERDLAVRGILNFLAIIDRREAAGGAGAPPHQASSIRELRAIAKHLGGKLG